MKEILRLVGVLLVICLVCSALMAAVYEKTREPIRQAGIERQAKAAREVMPPGISNAVPVIVGGVTNYAAYDAAGRLLATATVGRSSAGYGGDIVLMVGIADGQVLDYRVLQQSETPGLGTRIAASPFRDGIRGRRIENSWRVEKDGGEVDAVTSATISSRAALEAIRQAVSQHVAVAQATLRGPEGDAP